MKRQDGLPPGVAAAPAESRPQRRSWRKASRYRAIVRRAAQGTYTVDPTVFGRTAEQVRAALEACWRRHPELLPPGLRLIMRVTDAGTTIERLWVWAEKADDGGAE